MITLLIDLSDGDSEPETEPESGLWDDSDKSFMEWYNYKPSNHLYLTAEYYKATLQ